MISYSDRIGNFFNRLSKDTMNLVTEFYSEDAEFFDPLVALKGSKEIKKYYSGLYQSVQEIHFEFSDIIEAGHTVAAPWVMHLRTSKLNSGKAFSVPGISNIKFNPQSRQAIYHRDYFDMGAFIYEHIPVLGASIRFVKRRLHS